MAGWVDGKETNKWIDGDTDREGGGKMGGEINE